MGLIGTYVFGAAVALLAALLCAVSSASAQSYYLDYTGSSGPDTITLDAIISGMNCNSGCTVASPSELGGTFTLDGTSYAISFNGDDAPGTAGYGNINTFSDSLGLLGAGLDFDANGDTYNITSVQTGTGTASGTINFLGASVSQGTLDYGEEPTPAPVVGGGEWSWAALALTGLFGAAARRKKVLSSAQSLIAASFIRRAAG